MTEKTEHRDAGWLAQLAEKDRQIQALQAAYEDTSASLQRALAALAEHDEAHRKRQAAAAYQYHQQANRP
jgi:hypothetical protein